MTMPSILPFSSRGPKNFKSASARLLLVLFVLLCPFSSRAKDVVAEAKCPVTIEYFFQPGCAECGLIKNNVLPKLEEQYAGLCQIKKYDTGVKENFLRLAAWQDRLKNNDNKPVYMVVNGRRILAGYKQIADGVFGIIDEIIADYDGSNEAAYSATAATDGKDLLRKKGAAFKAGAVMVAGLVDGINPCVFSTLVFFLSLLIASGVKGFKLLAVGCVYCISCFITYLGIGVGLFRAVKLFAGYHFLQVSINVGMTLLLLLFAFLSFRDAWRYHASGRASSVTIKLPSSLQTRIHSIMRHGLSYKYLVPGIFSIGVLATVIESVCTGQVYVPTLALLSHDAGLFSKWFLYLLLYNVMFIIPLVVVFIAAHGGARTFELIKWSKKSLVVSKILMGLFFIVMSVLMLLL